MNYTHRDCDAAGEHMARVDAKGRIVLPHEARERLGLSPGTEVAVRWEGGRIVVERSNDPEAVIQDLAHLVEGATTNRTIPNEISDPIARDHLDSVRSGVENGGKTPDN